MIKADQGTLIAPIGTIIVSGVFVIFGCYGLSGAKVIRRLPLQSLVIYLIAAACIIRGVLPIQLRIRKPDKVTETVLIVGIIWLLVGLCYLFGYRAVTRQGN